MARPQGNLPRLAVLALFGALSIAWTWPLATHLGSRVAFDPGDPFLNTWILWWNAQSVPLTDGWWSPPVFYPMRGALALSEHLAGIAPFTTPLIHLGAPPALAYNAALLLSYVLSGVFACALVHRLSGSTPAALCAGLAFAFAPFRAGQLSHLQVLTAQWLPLQLLALHAYLDTSRRRWLVLFATAWILQGLSNGYYLMFAPVLVGAWIAWFVVARRRWAQLRAIAVTGAIASVPLVITLLDYRRVHDALGLSRDRSEMIGFSAGLHSFLNPPHMLRFWPTRDVPGSEGFLFPGLTIVAIVAVALLALALSKARGRGDDRPGPFLFYACAALLMAALTLGPATPEDGWAGWLKPYQWLVQLPGFSGLRVPARFAMLMALCLAVAGGLGLAMILPARRTLRAAGFAVAALGIGVDGWMEPMGASVPPGRIELPDVPDAAVIELPPDDTIVSVRAMFRSTFHGRPLVNGYSGHIPPHYDILSQSLRRRDPSAIVELARGRPLVIAIPEQHDGGGLHREVVESIPGIERRGLSAAGMIYMLRAQPRRRTPEGGTAHAFTATSLPRGHLLLDLGSTVTIRRIELPLRDRYPALGRRVAIEASLDGQAWSTVWEDWTGGLAMIGALEHQLEVPIRFALPDVSARYLRIHPADDWPLAELRVIGP